MVEGGGLENHCAGNGTGGSNPSSSVFVFRLLLRPYRSAGWEHRCRLSLEVGNQNV